MKLGVFLQAQWDASDPSLDIEAEIASLVRQAELAEALGFDSVWVPQHLVSAPYASIQPSALLGLLAAQTKRVRLGTGVYLLPFTHPVVAAEDMASLDWITGGRLIFGAGMGYRADEFEAIGVPMNERVGRFTESIELIRRLWSEDAVTHAGRYHQLDEVSISLKPKQAGGPQVWIGASVAAAVRRAAQLGAVWVSSMNPTFEELRGLFSEFDDARADLPRPQDRPTMRECFIGPSSEIRDILYAKYRAYQAWGVASSRSRADDVDAFDALMQEKFLIGDEDTVSERVRWLRDEIGVDHLIARVRWPGLSESKAFDTMRKLADVSARL